MAGSHGTNFIGSAAESVGLGGYENLLTAALVALCLIVVGAFANRQLQNTNKPTIPDGKLTLRNLFELLVTFVMAVGDMVMGKHNRKYLPFTATVFIYIFSMNLIGLIPGFSAPTDHPGINVGIAALVFLLYHYWGIREVGIGHYVKHFCGPVNIHWVFWGLAPFILTLELISHFVRPLTLTLRLFGNMTADHAVLSAFTELTKPLYVPVPVIFYILGTLVCFIQAFVFFVLTSVYISLAVAHEEEGHEEAH